MILALLILLAAPQAAPPLAELLTRAQDHMEAGDRSAARADLDEALRAYPASPAVRNFLGVLAASGGDPGEAERRFREAVERNPRYTDAWLNLGRLHQENAAKDAGAPRKALAAYESVLRYEPAHRDARFQAAALLQALGEPERSQAELERLPPEDRERPAALAVACGNLAARGARAEADAAAEKLLAHPDLAAEDVRPVLPVLAAHGRDDLVVRVVEMLRQKGLAASADLEALGAAYARQGQLALAREALEAAAASRPDDAALLLALARVAYEQKDLKGALGYLGHARAVAPLDPRVHFFLGMVCVGLDLGAEAYTALAEAVRLDPDNPEANYAFGSVAVHRKDPTEAVAYFRRYAELKPDDYRGPYAVGVALFLAKSYEAARTQLLPFAERKETAAGASYLLARIARALERGRGGAALRPPGGRGGPAQRRRVLRARAPLPAPGPGGARRGGPEALPRDRPGPLPRQPAPADALLADAGPAPGRAAGAVRRAEEAAGGAGGRPPPAGGDPALLSSRRPQPARPASRFCP